MRATTAGVRQPLSSLLRSPLLTLGLLALVAVLVAVDRFRAADYERQAARLSAVYSHVVAREHMGNQAWFQVLQISPLERSIEHIQDGLALSFESVSRANGITRLTGHVVNRNATEVTHLELVINADTSSVGCAQKQIDSLGAASCAFPVAHDVISIDNIPPAGGKPFAAVFATPADSDSYRWSVLVKEIGIRFFPVPHG